MVIEEGGARLDPPAIVLPLARLIPLGFCLALIGSGALLARAYRRTPITHTRRQIRLIAVSCLLVTPVWLVLLAIPALSRRPPLIAGHWLDLITGLVPLAYLVGGVLPSLYMTGCCGGSARC